MALQRAHRGDADIGHDTSPHNNRPGISTCAGFLRKNVTVTSAFTHSPVKRPRQIAMQPARHIDGDDRNVRFVQRGNNILRSTIQRTRQPRAEQRIDNDIGILDRIRRQRRNRVIPSLRHLGGIAFQRIARAEQRHMHIEAARLQMTRRHESVAAIVARPAQHRHAPVLETRRHASATARPAFSISVSDATPCSAAYRSEAYISALVRISDAMDQICVIPAANEASG